MPFINAPRAPLPNRVEGERPPQLVDHGDARLTATTWGDRFRDLVAPFMGDPASDAMGMVSPLAAPGAVGLGIVKTVTPEGVGASNKLVRGILSKTGKWGRSAGNEALEYLARRYPRLAQQVNFIMDEDLPYTTSARWSPDNYFAHRAELVAEGEGREAAKIGEIRLNHGIHAMSSGGDSVGDSVNSISHEMQHMADYLRQPQKADQAYDLLNTQPFDYEMNPFENLANITGATEQARYQGGAGMKQGRIDEGLQMWADAMRHRFPDSVKDVFAPFIPKAGENPADVLRALRAPNRVLASLAEGIVPGEGALNKNFTQQMRRMQQALRKPDALRKAILQKMR